MENIVDERTHIMMMQADLRELDRDIQETKARLSRLTWRDDEFHDLLKYLEYLEDRRGNLKAHMSHIGGLSLIEPGKQYPRKVREFLEQNGNLKVKRLVLCKVPVENLPQFLLKIISLGESENLKKKYGYDDFFHLYLIAVLEDDRMITIQKNAVIKIDWTEPNHLSPMDFIELTGYQRTQMVAPVVRGEKRRGPVTREIELRTRSMKTLNHLLDKAQKLMGDDKYFAYDPVNNNCQFYVRAILIANGIATAPFEKFMMQDAEKIFKDLPPWVEKFIRLVTTLAGYYDVIKNGGSIPEGRDTEASWYIVDSFNPFERRVFNALDANLQVTLVQDIATGGNRFTLFRDLSQLLGIN